MFTSMWIRAMAVCSLTLVLAFPCYGQSSTSGYDRMDGDYVKPSKRAQPKRNFNLATQARADGESSRRVTEYRSASSATRANARREDDREESRAVQTRKTSGRNSQDSLKPSDDTNVAPPESDERTKSPQGYETTEATDVADDASTTPVERAAPVNDNQLVYCSKTLLEFHWNAECPMLKNVKPTRLTYKQARDSRYAECTSCGAKR